MADNELLNSNSVPRNEENFSSGIDEKMIPASRASQIIEQERLRALDKGRQEGLLLAEQRLAQQQASSQPNQGTQSVPQQSSAPQSSGISPEEMRKMIAEETKRVQEELLQRQRAEQNQYEAQRIVQEFSNKIEAGKSKYSDFDDVLKDAELGSIPHIVQLANSVDNTADVMYEVLKNPMKIANLTVLAQTNPKYAAVEMRKISEQIKANEKASNQKTSAEPLSHLRPSHVASDNGDNLSIRDLKNLSWLRPR